jgi:hypothetical protein
VESERLASLAAGDEVVAVVEQGEWLQVKLYYHDDEDEDKDDEVDDDDVDEEEEDEEEEEEAQFLWALRRTADGREVLIPGPAPEGDLRNVYGGLGDAYARSGESLADLVESMHDEDGRGQERPVGRRSEGTSGLGGAREKEARFRVIDAAGLQVRKGIEPSSPVIALLGKSSEVTVVQEAADSRGTVRIKLIYPVRGWAAKRPGVLEKLTAEDGADDEGAGLEGLSEEEAEARLEDCMEQEAGQESFRKDERYFPPRQSGAGGKAQLTRASYAYVAGGYGYGRVLTDQSAKRIRLLGHDSVNSSWKAVTATTPRDLQSRLESTLQSLTALHARQLVVNLLLRWRSALPERLPASETPQLAPLLLANEQDKEKTASVAELLEQLLRLFLFRGSGDETSADVARFARFCGRPLLDLFKDASGLEVVTSALKTLPAVLSPVVQAILLSGSQLAEAFEQVCLKTISRQLQMAASRSFADASWSESSYQNDDDSDALTQPNIHVVRWLSRLLYETVRDYRGLSKGAPVVSRIFASWRTGLKSPNLALKCHACTELALMLSDVLGQQSQAKAASEDTSDTDRLLRGLVEVLPLKRLKVVAVSRLGMENEDAPMFSRYVQSLMELLAVADFVKATVAEQPATGVSGTVEASLDVPKPPDTEGRRAVLKFTSAKGSHIYIEAGRELVDPPWTAEFWIRRDVESEEGAAATTDGRARPRMRRNLSSSGALAPPEPARGPSEIPIPPPGPLLSWSSGPVGLPPQLTRTRSIGPPDAPTDTSKVIELSGMSSPARSHGSTGSEVLGVFPGDAKESGNATSDDEYLLLNTEDIPAFPGTSTTGASSGAPAPAPSIATSGAGSGGAGPGGEASSPPDSGAKGLATGGGQSRGRGRGRAGRTSPAHRRAASSKSGGGGATGTVAATTVERPQPKTIPPLYLVRSSSCSIKLQAGGKVFPDSCSKEKEQEAEVVPSQALCVAVSVSGEPDRTFDFVMPYHKWTHLAFVARRSHRSADVSLFVDGELRGTIALKMSLPIQVVGSHNPSESFTGQLALFRYWTYDRSGGEIARDMRIDVSEASDGLLGAWKVDEGQGVSLTEKSNSFRSCFQRNCTWQTLEDVPVLRASMAEEVGLETLLHPSKHPSMARDEAKVQLEFTGAFERTATAGVEGPWVRSSREPVVIRYAVPEAVATGELPTEPIEVTGVIEWPEKRLRTLCRGKVVGAKVELAVHAIAEGCPSKHAWVVGAEFRGGLSDDRRQLTGAWTLQTTLTRKNPLEVGGMRIDPVFTHEDVVISDDDLTVSRSDLGNPRSPGCMVTVEVCTVPPIPREPTDVHNVRGPEQLEVLEETVKRTMDEIISSFSPAEPPSPAHVAEAARRSFGYTTGRWYWEWLIVNNSSGNIGLGVCTAKAGMTAPLGQDDEGWAYCSTSEMMHAGDGPKGFGASESFGNGDVIGIELDLYEGRVSFIKNDQDLGLFFTGLRDHPALRVTEGGAPVDITRLGLRPCVFLGGPSDKVHLMGLKNGRGRRAFGPKDSFQRHSYEGSWRHGHRHGAGILRYRNFKSYWKGLWWRGSQHGLQLWIKVDEHGNEVSAAPFIFYKDVKIGDVPAAEAARIVAEWEAQRPAPKEPVKPEETTPPAETSEGGAPPAEAQQDASTAPTGTVASESPRVDLSVSELSGQGEGQRRAGGVETTVQDLKHLLATSTAAWIVRIVNPGGATVRNGVEIDLAEQVRNIPVGTLVEAFDRVVTREGIPRLQIRDGWISERLRGGDEDPVVEVLREIPKAPIKYRIKRQEGAMVRRGAELDTEPVGLIPCNTIITVTERRRIPDGTMRLKIVNPKEWEGWASEKVGFGG